MSNNKSARTAQPPRRSAQVSSHGPVRHLTTTRSHAGGPSSLAHTIQRAKPGPVERQPGLVTLGGSARHPHCHVAADSSVPPHPDASPAPSRRRDRESVPLPPRCCSAHPSPLPAKLQRRRSTPGRPRIRRPWKCEYSLASTVILLYPATPLDLASPNLRAAPIWAQGGVGAREGARRGWLPRAGAPQRRPRPQHHRPILRRRPPPPRQPPRRLLGLGEPS